ncbi:MAG TPA: efflux RND transporter periplasmic adaptor subunit [Gemmatimonadales bacterium]|nr:efflux RND transporter periplasmic adaptor subunit [Gemmatimonadales bacterium]
MTRHLLLIGAIVLALGCTRKTDESPMPGMTAEQHAAMQMQDSGAAMQMSGTMAMDTGDATRQAVHLTRDEERALGVTYVTVRRDSMVKSIRTVGEISAAEPRIADVTPKIGGFVERLDVDETGQSVRRGQALLAIYSPELVTAQEELLTAKRLVAGLDSTAGEAWTDALSTLDAARRRLAYWDITKAQIARLEQRGTVQKTLTLVSPVTGIVMEKNVLDGQHVMPGERLYRIADLSEVWVEGEVFEQDMANVRLGARAHIEVSAYPGEHIMGRVSFVYPTVNTQSRTNRVRVTVSNRDLRLKPGMFATIYFDATIGDRVLTVPMAAVIATGERNLVFVRDSLGMLKPREVVLGTRAGDRVQILRGLAEGETIVGSANFLVDAESRLASTPGSMPGMNMGGMDMGGKNKNGGGDHDR